MHQHHVIIDNMKHLKCKRPLGPHGSADNNIVGLYAKYHRLQISMLLITCHLPLLHTTIILFYQIIINLYQFLFDLMTIYTTIHNEYCINSSHLTYILPIFSQCHLSNIMSCVGIFQLNLKKNRYILTLRANVCI